MASWATLKSLQTGQPNHQLTDDKISIGRKSTNNIQLKNQKLSATHCIVYKEGGVAYLEDNSSNGTFLNDTKMTKGAKLPLKDGDKVWLLHPSKVPEPLGFEFTLTSSPIVSEDTAKKNDLKRDQKKDDDETTKKAKEELDKKKADSDDLVKSIKEQITCPMCLEVMFIPVAVHPCNHRFCGSCLTSLVKSNKSECIKCRKQITTAQRDSSFNSIIEDYLKKHPEDKRSKEQEQDLRKNNIFGPDTVDIAEKIHGKSKVSATTAVTVGSRVPLKSGRAPGVTLTSTRAPRRAVKGRKGSDISAESSDDDIPVGGKCRECVNERNGFKCTGSTVHVACSNCKKLIARRDDPKLHQNCVICSDYFCNLYYPPCSKSGNKLALVRNQTNLNIDKEIFRNNDFELTTYRNYLVSKRMSARDVLGHVIKQFLDKDNFNFLIDQKVTPIKPTASQSIPIKGDSSVCDICWKQLWFQLVLRHRMSVNNELPVAVSGRADCYYGINCTTMSHKLDHAKKLNHCCYQTRFH